MTTLSVFQKVRFYLAIVALIIIAGALFKRCGGCSPTLITEIPKALIPKFPDLHQKNGEIEILDSTGKLVPIKYKDSKKVVGIVSIKNLPDSNGNPTPPTTLIVEKKNPGLFPELFNEPEIEFKSLGIDSNITVLNFKKSNFEFEYNPLVGINYSKKQLEASLGINLVKVYFLHISASVSYSQNEIQPNLDLNSGIKIELLPYIFIGYDYGILSSQHKVSLHYCYKFN